MTTLSGPELPPLSGAKPSQLVLLLHGLGANGEDLISLADEWSELLPDAHFIAPNAPFACDMAPFGYQWFSLREWTEEKVMEGLHRVQPIVESYIETQLARFQLPMQKLALVGFSQGTMTSLYVALRQAKPCAGILGYSGALVGGGQLANAIKARPPVCLVHGDSDAVVPYSAFTHALEDLEACNVPVEGHTRRMLGHGIDMEGIRIGGEALARWLLGNK